MFVEVRTAGGEDWTTLPDANGHTSQSTGDSCPGWQVLHPFPLRYQSPTRERGDGSAGGQPGAGQQLDRRWRG